MNHLVRARENSFKCFCMFWATGRSGGVSIGFRRCPFIDTCSSERRPASAAVVRWLPSILFPVTDHLSPYFSPVLALLPCSRMFLRPPRADRQFACHDVAASQKLSSSSFCFSAVKTQTIKIYSTSINNAHV